MDLDSLMAAKKVVGTKETLRLMEKGQPKVVLIAKDAQREIVDPLIALCDNKQIEIVWIEDLRLLGKICGVAVKTAAAAILE